MTAPSITCPRCGFTSYNPNDIEQRYCGHCHAFQDDDPLPLYRSMRTKDLRALRAAHIADRQSARGRNDAIAERFGDGRIAAIDQVLAERNQ